MKLVMHSLFILIMGLALAVGAPAAVEAANGSGTVVKKSPEKKTKISRSGRYNRNKRIRMEGTGLEIVIGKIAVLKQNGIGMDGEFFEYRGAKIADEYGRRIKKKDLYIGLEAHITLSYGQPEKITIYKYTHPESRALPLEGNEEKIERIRKHRMERK